MLETIFPLIVIGSLVMMVVAIKAMSSAGHAREIYLIWYINSFFFMLFYGVGIIAEERNVRLTEILRGLRGHLQVYISFPYRR